MKIRSVELAKVLGVKSELFRSREPEFVMAGRSNVGKSSFINSFIRRKSYARISSTPGKTRTINFYHVNGSFYLVDLPGYGYAATGAVEQEKWDRMIRKYLRGSESIEEVILLVDIRHDPTKQDIQMFRWIVDATGYEPIVILTKSDKIGKTQLEKRESSIRAVLGASDACRLIPFSARSRQGLEEIYEIFDSLLTEEAASEADHGEEAVNHGEEAAEMTEPKRTKDD